MTTTQTIVADFFGKNLIAFYPSGVDGTLCVRVQTLEGPVSHEVDEVAKSIVAHKRFMDALKAAEAA